MSVKPGTREVVEVRSWDACSCSYNPEPEQEYKDLFVLNLDLSVLDLGETTARTVTGGVEKQFPVGSLVVLEATDKFDTCLGETVREDYRIWKLVED